MNGKKEIHWGIGGNQERIFISTSFGCRHHCAYCYLKDMGIHNPVYTYQADELLNELESRRLFVPGKEGSLITIGCYTECLDGPNIDTTIFLIRHFLELGNIVQISTKRKIEPHSLAVIAEKIQYEKQMNIFISLPTISRVSIWEPDAESVEQRIENLAIQQEGIAVYLYIKPVLEGVTILDKALYANLVKTYKTPAVIGEMMHPVTKRCGQVKLIGNTYMQETPSWESDELIKELRAFVPVFRHSDEAIEQMKNEQ